MSMAMNTVSGLRLSTPDPKARANTVTSVVHTTIDADIVVVKSFPDNSKEPGLAVDFGMAPIRREKTVSATEKVTAGPG